MRGTVEFAGRIDWGQPGNAVQPRVIGCLTGGCDKTVGCQRLRSRKGTP